MPEHVRSVRRDLAEAVARFIAGKRPTEPLFPTLPQVPGAAVGLAKRATGTQG